MMVFSHQARTFTSPALMAYGRYVCEIPGSAVVASHPRAAMVQRRERGDGALSTALGIRRSPDTDQHFKGDQRTKLW